MCIHTIYNILYAYFRGLGYKILLVIYTLGISQSPRNHGSTV